MRKGRGTIYCLGDSLYLVLSQGTRLGEVGSMKDADIFGEWLKYRMWPRRMAQVERETESQIRYALVYNLKFEPFE